MEPPDDVYLWTVDPAAGARRARLRGDRVRARHPGGPGRRAAGRRRADQPAERARRQARRRPHRHHREPPGGHQVPRDLRGARRRHPARRPPGTGEDDPDQGPGCASRPRSPPSSPTWSTTASGSRPAPGPGGLRRQHPAPRDRHHPDEAVQGHREPVGRQSPQVALRRLAWPPTTGATPSTTPRPWASSSCGACRCGPSPRSSGWASPPTRSCG